MYCYLLTYDFSVVYNKRINLRSETYEKEQQRRKAFSHPG